MQPTHLEPLFQALRQEGRALAWAFGAICGAAVFFGWPKDLMWELGLVPLGAGLVLAAFWREAGWFLVALGLSFALAGHQVDSAGEGFNWAAAARKPHWVTGRVVEMIDQEKATRVTLVLRDVKFYQLPGAEGVKEVRAGVFRNQIKGVGIGDGVAVPILLVAPEGPKFKGDRDSRLWRYMDRSVVRGYARGTAEPTWLPPAPAAGPLEKGSSALDDMRARIAQSSKGEADGVVTALLVGDQKGVTPEVRDAYRATGLTHLIAISGMQLTLVGGGTFLLIRKLAARVPGIALRYNVKAIAAAFGLVGAAAYTLLVGAQVSVVRSFVMLALVMVAALSGRMRSGLRAWCVAVVVILLVSPVMVLSAGFQLSVAAVLGLLIWGLTETMPKGVLGWGHGMVKSSVVAGAATAPLVVWNFGQLSAVSLLANVVAVPLMGLATYVGMAGLVSQVGGVQAPVLHLMSWIVGLVNAWAVWLASWQGSVGVDCKLWPLVALTAVATLVGVVWRHWMATGLGILAMGALAWGASRMEAPLQVAVLDGGKVGVVAGEGAPARLAWAEDRRDAPYLLKSAGLQGTGEGSEIPEVADEALMPVSKVARFAWAEKRGGTWEVEPVTCGRVWQRTAEVCHGVGANEESPSE